MPTTAKTYKRSSTDSSKNKKRVKVVIECDVRIYNKQSAVRAAGDYFGDILGDDYYGDSTISNWDVEATEVADAK